MAEERGATKDPVGGEKGRASQAWEHERLSRATSGDSAAFGELVDHYGPRIFTHLIGLVGNREEAEDLTQEAFIRAYRYLGHYDPSRPFKTWLYTIATNLGYSALRARRARGITVPIEEAGTGEERFAATPKDDPRRRIELGELETRLGRAVERLPSQSAALVQLHYREGMTIGEAAEVMGITENAAKVALHRARKSLRQWLVEDEG